MGPPYERFGDELADTEIINVPESKTEDGFELPVGMSGHCSVLINFKTVMVLGGNDGTKSTYFIDLETFQVTPGPEMQEARHSFGCAVFEHNQQSFVIAAGGWQSKDSTEFFNLNSKIWSRGKTDFLSTRNSRLHFMSYTQILNTHYSSKLFLF